jgi:hypothetical protein
MMTSLPVARFYHSSNLKSGSVFGGQAKLWCDLVEIDFEEDD